MKKILPLLAFTVLLSIVGGCLRKSDSETGKNKPGTSPLPTEVPSGFDWKNTQDVILTVIPNDQYSGRFKYMFEVFTENPMSYDAAKVIKGVSTNTSTPIHLTIPKGISTLYVRQSDPLSRKMVQAVEVNGNELTCNFAPIGTKTRTNDQSSFANIETRTITVEPTPADAIVLSGSANKSLETGKTYVIPQGTTYSGSLTFPDQGNMSLYVEGVWKMTQSSVTMHSRTKIVVQNSGELASTTASTISMVGTGEISLINAARGKISAEQMSIEVNNSNSTITNMGTMYVGEFNMDGGIADNYGIMTIKSLKVNGNNTVLTNYATIDIREEATIQNATVYNYCFLSSDEKTGIELRAATIHIMDNSLFSAYDVTCSDGKSTVNIGNKAVFDVRNRLRIWDSGKNVIQGAGKDASLARIYKIDLKGDECVIYRSVQVECWQHTQNNKPWDKKYILEQTAVMVPWGESTIEIPKNDCSGTGNIPGDGDGSEEDQDKDIVYDSPYNYVMEDNWPNMGDYDMNDLVIELNNYIESPKNKKITLNFKLKAVGATKTIGASIQLDGITPSMVANITVSGGSKDANFPLASNGVENNQQYAVLQLFSDAHMLFTNTASRKPINTTIADYSVKNISVEIQFNSIAELNLFTISKLNLFIVTSYNQKTGKRQEVHLRGYEPTNMADRSFFNTNEDDSSQYRYKSKENFVWGIMIPGEFAYPAEYKNISKAYPDFISWVSSGGNTNENWYTNPDSQYVIK